MTVRRALLALALAVSLVGWLGLARVAWRFARLPPSVVPLEELGWPREWSGIEKVLLLPDGTSAYVVLLPEHGDQAQACRVDLTTGRARDCTQLPLHLSAEAPSHSWRGTRHAYAAGQLVLVSYDDEREVAHVFDRDGLRNRFELPAEGFRVRNVAWDAALRRFEIFRAKELYGGPRKVEAVMLPAGAEGVRVEPDPLIGPAIRKWNAGRGASIFVEGEFPDGTMILSEPKRTCLVAGGRAAPRCASEPARVRIGSTELAELYRPGRDDLWVDARGKETSLAPALEGMTELRQDECDLTIALRDDGSEEPRIACPGSDESYHVRLGSSLVAMRVIDNGAESVLVAEHTDGRRDRIAKVMVSSTRHIGVIPGDQGVLVLAGGAMPLTPSLEPRLRPTLWQRLRPILRRRVDLAPVATAGYLGALSLYPLLAALGVRVIRRPSGWAWFVAALALLVLHASFAWTALLHFGRYLNPP